MGARRNLAALKEMAMAPDDYIKLMLDQPRFNADEVLSQTSTTDASMTAAGDVDEDMAAFKRFEQRAWDTDMKITAHRSCSRPKPIRSPP